MLIYPKARMMYPMALEREYAKILRDYTRGVRDVCLEYLPYMVDEAMANGIQTDARQDSWLSNVVDRVKEAIDSRIRITEKVNAMYEKVKGFAKRQQERVFRALFGSTPERTSQRQYDALKEVWVNQNLGLINSIDDRTLEAIHYALARNIIRTVDKKMIVDELKETIMHMAGVNERRAALIACDQVGKLNSQIVQYEQTSQGVEEYIWRTMRDNRVRELHQVREGKRFRWDSPPSDGHPGWPIRCRCTAVGCYDTDKIGLRPRKNNFRRVEG